MRIGLICGGPSAERGISLNSARSAMDHLSPLGWEIVPFYCDPKKNFYRLSPSQLYSNTPSDFDFKLGHTAQPLALYEFISACRETDIVFPTIHGSFGEDGELQSIFEANNIPFVGSPAEACLKMFDKAVANNHLAKNAFPTLPNCRIDESDNAATRGQKIADFFRRHNVTKVVVKPSAGGSSLGVAVAHTPQEAEARTQDIFDQKHGTQALIEPYCHGREFTVVVLQNHKEQPVALIPTEISLSGGDLFTFRHKYLPTCQVEYHCPPRFDAQTIARIQKDAEVLFSFFGMRDFARLDGWLLDDGQVIFSDFNPISGMEQNSYLFIQGSRVGFTHGEILRYVVSHAAKRYGIDASVSETVKNPDAHKIRVLFGGMTAERQVSLMSGTNVWLKLLHTPDCTPEPYILGAGREIWHLPYSFTLNHTVEEILTRCGEAHGIIARLRALVPSIRERLGIKPLADHDFKLPRCMSFEKFCQEAVDESAFVFIALHGGEGEDGTLQTEFDRYGIAYNGSDPEASQLCMNKKATADVIFTLNDPLLTAAAKIIITAAHADDAETVWNDAVRKFKTSDILIKPQSDGCSAGVARLSSAAELKIYLHALARGKSNLAAGALSHQSSMIELPSHTESLMLEPFIVTDAITVSGLELAHIARQGWIELTVGVLEENGHYHALSPSITVASGSVLSLEEKFQGGTGVNLTPPPSSIITAKQIDLIKTKIEQAAKALGIQGYARIDIFFNTHSEQTLVIEANSLPGLTPSTVIYHQALAEQPTLTPQAFLSLLVDYGLERRAIGDAKTIPPARVSRE